MINTDYKKEALRVLNKLYDRFKELKDFTSFFKITPKLINPRKPSVKETIKKKSGSYFSADLQAGNTSFGEPPSNL